MTGRKVRLKSALIVLSLSIAGLAVVYQQVYPLSLTAGTGYLSQVPPVLWVFVVLALASLFFVATLARSPLGTLGSIVGLALVLNVHYFLVYGVTGRDMRGEVARLFFSLDRAHLGVDLYSYFQWPVHFIVTQQLDRVLSLPLTDMIWVGYLAYYVLFGCAIGLFAYSFTDGDTFPWIAAAVFYVVFTRQWLNNQFVPQFIALVVLLFLFAIHDVDDTRFRLLRGLLYVLLVLAHPFFFSFYLLYVLVLPSVRAVIGTLETVGTADRPLYYQSLEVVRHPLRGLLALQSNLRRQFDVSWLTYVGFLVGTYLAFLLVRFSLFKERLFLLLSGPMTESSSSKIPSRVMEILFGTSQYDGGAAGESAVDTVLLYDLTSSVLKDITLYGTIGVLLALLVVSAIVLFLTPSSRVPSPSIGVVIAGVAYYVAGFVLPLIGTRAFQVFLLPLGTFLKGVQEHRQYLYAFVLIALVVSPVVVANFMVNYSLTAGGNTHDLHADEAGRFLMAHSDLERHGAVTYPNAGFPVDLTRSGEDLQISTVEAIIVAGANTSETIVYGRTQEYEARHFGHRCSFRPDRRNVIYDNRIRVLEDSLVSEPFACRER